MSNSTFRTTDTGEVSRWNPKLARWDVLTPNALSVVEKAPVAAMSVQNSPALMPYGYGGGGWLGAVLEPFTGAWQRNIECRNPKEVSAFSAVYTCISLISGDISKLRVKLVEQVNGIWREVPPDRGIAHRPVLNKPNDFQTRIQFYMQWIASKLTHGNAYILKERDQRNVVTSMFVLDPRLVTPLVAENGSIYYMLKRDPLASVIGDEVAVPAADIIHDTMVTLWHPLVGVSPIYACGSAAIQGLRIQADSEKFFGSRSLPAGVLKVPGDITDAQLEMHKARWDRNYGPGGIGGTAVLKNGMTFESMRMTSVDAQLIEQLKWTVEDVARCFHIPLHMLGVMGSNPSYNNIGALNQQYYAQTLQVLIESIELLLDEGLGLLQAGYGAELDLEALVRMDPAARMEVAAKGVGGSVLRINEARAKEDLPAVSGGDLIWMQQQNYSLQALAERDRNDPFAKQQPVALPPPDEEDDEEEARERAAHDFLSKELADAEYA